MRFLGAGMIGVLLACGPSPAARPTSLRAEADSARAMVEGIPAILAAQGPLGWARVFEAGPSFSMATEGQLVFPSRAVADSALADYATRFRAMELTWQGLEVEPAAPGVVSVRSGFDETITDTGGAVLRFRGYLTALATRGDSGWRLRQLHWSLRERTTADLPAASGRAP